MLNSTLARAASMAVLAALTLGACGSQGTSPDELPSSPQAAYPKATLDSTKIWKVQVADVLNCRENPGTAQAVVFSFKSGTVLDVVDSSRTAKDGYTWIHVNPRGDLDHNECYVAADDRWLKPANGIDADQYPVATLAAATVFKPKTALNCRTQPTTSAPIVFEAMPVGTILDIDTSLDASVSWSQDSYWVHVDPRGDTDHNTCWVSARKSLLAIVK